MLKNEASLPLLYRLQTTSSLVSGLFILAHFVTKGNLNFADVRKLFVE